MRLLVVLLAVSLWPPGCSPELVEVDKRCSADGDCFADEFCDQSIRYCRPGARETSCDPVGTYEYQWTLGDGPGSGSGTVVVGQGTGARYTLRKELEDPEEVWTGECEARSSSLHCQSRSSAVTWHETCDFVQGCEVLDCDWETSEHEQGSSRWTRAR